MKINIRFLKNTFLARSKGTTLIETLVALALFGIIAVVFVSGLATAARATIIANEQTTAESIARSQMEFVKNAAYIYEASEYAADSLPTSDDYAAYSVTITSSPLNSPDDGIQKIIVTVSHNGASVISMQEYKVDR